MISDDNSQQISINLDQIHCSRAEDINFLTINLSPIVECIYFHKNIHPNITKRRSYSAEISRHPKFHTSLNAPTIPILLGLSTWREKKYPYKDGELELWTVLWPYEYPCTTELGRSGHLPERTFARNSCWYIILVKPRSLSFTLGYLHIGNSNAYK